MHSGIVFSARDTWEAAFEFLEIRYISRQHDYAPYPLEEISILECTKIAVYWGSSIDFGTEPVFVKTEMTVRSFIKDQGSNYTSRNG